MRRVRENCGEEFMTCNYMVNELGVPMIVCSRNNRGPDEMEELKKAMACRRWEICSKCESYGIYQRVLAKRREETE